MKLIAAFIGMAVLSMVVLVALRTPKVRAQDSDASATIAALEERRAELEATVERIGTQIARLEAQSAPAETAIEEPDVEWINIGGGIDLYYYFENSGSGSLYFLGEFRNNNDSAVSTPTVLVTLLDNDGNIVGTARSIDLYPIISPDETTPFQSVASEVYADSWDDEVIEVVGYGSGITSCTTGLELRDLSEVERTQNRFRLNGSAFNGGEAPADGVLVWVAFYRSDGVYAGMTNESVQATIPPGKSAVFSVFGLPSDLPGFVRSGAGTTYTYRTFVTNTTGGTTYC